MAEISRQFIDVSMSDLDSQFTRALQSIGEFLGVDRTFVARLEGVPEKAVGAYEWYAAHTVAMIDTHVVGTTLADFSWFADQLRGRAIRVCAEYGADTRGGRNRADAVAGNGCQVGAFFPTCSRRQFAGISGIHFRERGNVFGQKKIFVC